MTVTTWYCNVSVASIWTSPESAREIDKAGMSSYGYDCSGLTYNLLKACGHTIPRDAADQATTGEEIDSANPVLWERGDLLFFSDNQGNVRHVGFYFGGGIMLHAPATGHSVELLKLQASERIDALCAVRRFGMTINGNK